MFSPLAPSAGKGFVAGAALLAAFLSGARADEPSEEALILGKVLERGLSAPAEGTPGQPAAPVFPAALEETLYVPGQGVFIVLGAAIQEKLPPVENGEGKAAAPAPAPQDGAEGEAVRPAVPAPAGPDLWTEAERELRDGALAKVPDAEAWTARVLDLLRTYGPRVRSIPRKESITVVLRDTGRRGGGEAAKDQDAPAPREGTRFVMRRQISLSAPLSLIGEYASGEIGEAAFRKEAKVAAGECAAPADVQSRWASPAPEPGTLAARMQEWMARQPGGRGGFGQPQPQPPQPDAARWRWQRGGGGGAAPPGGGGGRGDARPEQNPREQNPREGPAPDQPPGPRMD